MTTKVTVDAHAGWPVRVESIDHDGSGATVRADLGIVPALASQSFYAHAGRQIVVTELPKVNSEN